MYGSNTGSASGYVIPCLEWGKAFHEVMKDHYAWHHKGAPTNVLEEVRATEKGVIRIGAVNGELLVEPKGPRYAGFTVRGKNGTISPHAGISIVTTMNPRRHRLSVAAFDKTLQDVSSKAHRAGFRR